MSKIDPKIQEILTKYKAPADAVWQHKQSGQWIAKHKALEVIAANAGIVFDMPQIIQCDLNAKTVCICVKGVLNERSEWSFGEATAYNSQNQYYAAMAEKRAKDRVILKLLGLHGTVYSDEEADEFKEKPKQDFPTGKARVDLFNAIVAEFNKAETLDALEFIGVSRKEDIEKLKRSDEQIYHEITKLYKNAMTAFKSSRELDGRVPA